ncbi:extracellular superoxide dismutase [Cu-Zn] [Hyperolius riggenbachi]|uniref:extracellular superoxide dismutase [Cu-Zn] n=1 Tax=Hyperolius riggenbachi TaxID=752182 RepID=UPI0035A3481E
MRLFFLAFILSAYTSCDVHAGSHDQNEAGILSDMLTKIDDIWNWCVNPHRLQKNDDTLYAICNLQPNSKLNATEPNITGDVLFKQCYPDGKLEAHFCIRGFPTSPNGSLRAIHIHTYGDLSNGCDSTGGHYNPNSVNHPNHPGDFGNFQVKNGNIQQHLHNLQANLFGPLSVIGRSVVVHKLADDLGKGNNQASLENGNAGLRLACCIIGITTNASWVKWVSGPGNQ